MSDLADQKREVKHADRKDTINCKTSVRYARMVALLLFFPRSASKNALTPFSSVMAPPSCALFVIAPLLSHRGPKATRAGPCWKLVPITYIFFHYMEPLCDVSRGETGWRGTGKWDSRHRSRTMKGFHHPGGSQQAFLTGLTHLYNLVPYQRRAIHAGQCGVEVEGGTVPTGNWFLNL